MKDSIKHIVSSEQMIEQCVRDMKQMLSDHGYFNFEIKRGNRSLSQNALYWVWIGEIKKFINDHNGADFTDEEIHIKMKHEFLGYEAPRKIGSADIPTQLKSTSKLTSGEMFHYMSQIDMWSAGINLHLPRPDDCQYELNKRRQVS